jgi:GT2 family glycosyltransferase
MTSRLTVGIVTYNRKEKVLKAIESVVTQNVEDVEIIVVDNNSNDGTGQAIREKYPSVKYIRLKENIGCPSGRNYTFANCTGKYIINLDDDGYLGDGAIEKVIEVFDSDPTIGIIAMRQCYIGEPGACRIIGEDGKEVGEFYGGVSAFRKDMLNKIGYYPENFFFYHEEAVLALRAMDAGYRIISRFDIIMWHPRIGGGKTKPGRWDYYYFRNVLLVVTRLYPGWLMLKYLILRMGSHALYSIKRKTFHKYLCAVIYVLLHLPVTLMTRKPCRKETVKKYFRLRCGGEYKRAD